MFDHPPLRFALKTLTNDNHYSVVTDTLGLISSVLIPFLVIILVTVHRFSVQPSGLWQKSIKGRSPRYKCLFFQVIANLAPNIVSGNHKGLPLRKNQCTVKTIVEAGLLPARRKMKP